MDFDKTVFLTREEAEKALEVRGMRIDIEGRLPGLNEMIDAIYKKQNLSK